MDWKKLSLISGTEEGRIIEMRIISELSQIIRKPFYLFVCCPEKPFGFGCSLPF
jgi:hypothetical protein